MTRFPGSLLLGSVISLSLLVGAAAAFSKEGPGDFSKEGPRDRDAMLRAYDSNGDGSLSGEEIDALLADRRARFEERFLERWDSDGDGVLSEAERDAMREQHRQAHEQLIAKYDADGDGRLSRDEREAARADGAPLPRFGHRGCGHHGPRGDRAGRGAPEAPPSTE